MDEGTIINQNNPITPEGAYTSLGSIPTTPPPGMTPISSSGEKKNKYRSIIIGLGLTEFIFLIAIGGLYYELQNTKKTYEGEIIRIRTDSSQSVEVIKNDKEKELVALREEIGSLKKELDSYKEDDQNSSGSTSFDHNGDKSNDEIRISHLNIIATTLGAYYADREMYPPNDASGCLPQEYLNSNYFPKGVPVDPSKRHKNEGCSNPGEYVYRGYSEFEYERGNASTIRGAKFYAIGTKLDDPTLGNSTKPLSEYSEEETSSNNLYGHLSKGSGPYYIVTN